MPAPVNILYHEGCKITIGGSWQQDEVVPGDPAEDRRSIAEAVKWQSRRMSWSWQSAATSRPRAKPGRSIIWATGRRSTWSAVQDELVDAIAATGKPIIAFLFNGRPISIRNLAAKAQAIFECWYLGQETGQAVAEVLFGDVNPGGKLPITIPRSVGHLPRLLQLQACRPPRISFRRHQPALCVRLRPELYHI